jgi:hypothetical protein
VLPLLLNTPHSAEEWARWSYSHRISHNVIRDGIQAQFKVRLPEYLLDPIDLNDTRQFLEWNQQAHVDMNGALNVPGSDLEDVKFDDERQLSAWIWLHYLEHQVAENKLKVSS